MKKLTALLLALIMLFCLCACGQNAENNAENAPEENTPEENTAENNAGLPNPMTPYDSLEELNEVLGTKLSRPGVMGVTDEAFYLIDGGEKKVVEYDFSLNGYNYTYRCAATTQDISGVYTADGTIYGEPSGDEIEYASTDVMKLARWFTLDGQYVFIVTDNGEMDSDTFEGIAAEMKNGTVNGMTEAEYEAFYAELAGVYFDSTSQRATMEVEAEGAEDVKIKVMWSSSAAEFTQWTMTAIVAEDGLLVYHDCRQSVITTAEDGTQTEEVVYENGSGYFEVVEGKLLWTGAEDEECVGCVFEKPADEPAA